MNLKSKESFEKELLKINDKNLLNRIAHKVLKILLAGSISDISNLTEIKGAKDYFRLRIGDYRLGIIIKENSIIFVRCLHRKDIYKYFP